MLVKNYNDNRIEPTNKDLWKNIKGILFDMDGTLIDSEPFHASVLRKVLKDRLDDQIDPMIMEGMSLGETHSFLTKRGLTLSMEDYLSEVKVATINELKELTSEALEKMYAPGIVPYFKKMREHKYKVALVTASEDYLVEDFAKKSFIQDISTRIDNTKTHLSKPSPSPYFKGMRHLGLKTGESVIFEDSQTGLMAAKKTGAKTIQVKLSH